MQCAPSYMFTWVLYTPMLSETGIYLFKFSNRNTRTMCGVCSGSFRCLYRCLFVNFIMNRPQKLFSCFYCWLWTSKFYELQWLTTKIDFLCLNYKGQNYTYNFIGTNVIRTTTIKPPKKNEQTKNKLKLGYSETKQYISIFL